MTSPSPISAMNFLVRAEFEIFLEISTNSLKFVPGCDDALEEDCRPGH